MGRLPRATPTHDTYRFPLSDEAGAARHPSSFGVGGGVGIQVMKRRIEKRWRRDRVVLPSSLAPPDAVEECADANDKERGAEAALSEQVSAPEVVAVAVAVVVVGEEQ